MQLTRTAALLVLGLATAAPVAAAPFAYVPGSDGAELSIIDTDVDAVVDTIPLGTFYQGVAVSPDGKTVYLSTISSDSVAVFDALTKQFLAPIPVPGAFGVYSITLNPAGTRLYGTRGVGGVTVIDTTTNSVLTTISDAAFDGPQNIAVMPSGTKAYVTNAFGGKIAVVDLTSNTVLTTVPTFTSNRGIDILPDGSKAYVGEDTFGVRVIDTATDTDLGLISIIGGANGVASHPDGSKVYAMANGDVVVIDTTTDTVVTSVPAGFINFGISVHPDGSRVYAASVYTSEVFVVDTATNMSLGSIPVSAEPVARGDFIGPDFVCGDGTIDPGEQCDDSNVMSGDGCSSSCKLDCGNAATMQKVIVKKLDDVSGDDKLVFSGKVVLAGAPTLDPLTNGYRLRIEKASGQTLIDITVPGGAYAPPLYGWIHPKPDKWIYKAPGPFPPQGVVKTLVKTKYDVTPGLTKFLVKLKNGVFPLAPADLPLRALLILDPAAPSGVCAEATFDGITSACTFNGTATAVKCK